MSAGLCAGDHAQKLESGRGVTEKLSTSEEPGGGTRAGLSTAGAESAEAAGGGGSAPATGAQANGGQQAVEGPVAPVLTDDQKQTLALADIGAVALAANHAASCDKTRSVYSLLRQRLAGGGAGPAMLPVHSKAAETAEVLERLERGLEQKRKFKLKEKMIEDHKLRAQQKQQERVQQLRDQQQQQRDHKLREQQQQLVFISFERTVS